MCHFFPGDVPGHKWAKILMIFIFWPTKKKLTSECIFMKIIWKLLKKASKRVQAGLRKSIFCWNMKLWSIGKFSIKWTNIFVRVYIYIWNYFTVYINLLSILILKGRNTFTYFNENQNDQLWSFSLSFTATPIFRNLNVFSLMFWIYSSQRKQ